MSILAYEFLVVSLIVSSGVAAGLLLGLRHWSLLALTALATSTLIRSLTAFTAWSSGQPGLAHELWLSVSVVLIVISAAIRWRRWKHAVAALAALLTASAIAILTKLVLGVGERHHTDSADATALSLVVIQSESANLDPLSSGAKRGIAYPLMLALGPAGQILSSFTPLVFIVLVGGILWLAWRTVSGRVPPTSFWLTVTGIGLFSLSVPIVRVAMFYINAHTLMALALLILLAGFTDAHRNREFSSTVAILTVLGGTLGVLARVEGVVLVLVMVAAIISQVRWRGPDSWLRVSLALGTIGLVLTWWMVATQNIVLERFEVSGLALVLVTVAGSVLAGSKWIDKVRVWILPTIAGALILYLAFLVLRSGNPQETLFAQWGNLALGLGGWGTAAPAFLLTTALLGWIERSSDYRRLLALSWITIAAILFAKSFDGGFGRDGFSDSTNRMWLHSLPAIALTSLIGLSELLHNARRSWKLGPLFTRSQSENRRRLGRVGEGRNP